MRDTSIPDNALAAFVDPLDKANTRVARQFPGESPARQPVHVVYGGAHLFKADAARKIGAVPTGGVSFVDARDAATSFRMAMKKGRHGERYLLGAANWTFSKFFGRLERLTKVSAPKLALPSRLAITGANLLDSFFKQWDLASPVEPGAIEMAQYYWYLNCSKAARELAFRPRDPGETLHDTVAYLRENFLGSNAFGKSH